MKKSIQSGLFALIAFTSMSGYHAQAQTAPSVQSQTSSEDEKVWQAIEKDPERLAKDLKAGIQRIMQKTAEEGKPVDPEVIKALHENESGFHIGNTKNPITITLLSDPLCPACKAFAKNLIELNKIKPEYHIQVLNVPIIEKDSPKIALIEEAFFEGTPAKSFDLYKAVEEMPNATEMSVSQTARGLGMKPSENSKKSGELVAKATELAVKAHISGTPSFVIGNRIYTGVLPPEMLIKLVEKNK